MQRVFEISVSAFLLVAAVLLFAMTFSEQFEVPTFGGDVGPAFAPRGFLLIWMVLAAAATYFAFREAMPAQHEPVKSGQLLLVVAIAVGTALAMTRIGFVFATVPGFFLFCWAFGYRKWLTLSVISLIAPLTIWALFTFVFELLLPRSPWFHAL